MSKRALYSIPLTGLALTSVGCPQEPPPPPVDDAIVNTFTPNAVNGFVVPYLYAAVDINGDGSLVCDINYSATDLTIGADLTGAFTYNTAFSNCVDAAGAAATPPPDEAVNYAATVTIVTANTKYSIALAGGAVAVALDCDLANGALDCTDANGTAWAFTAQ